VHTEQIGTISCLIRYPVKSMLGETVLKADVTERGIEGDRTHAVFDVESGKIASAKRPWRWRALLKCTARTLATPNGVPGKFGLQLRFPDGSTITEHDAVDEVLSNFLQRPVRLVSRAPENPEIERSQPEEVLTHGSATDVVFQVGRLGRASPTGTFFDYAPIHLATTSTLRQISATAGVVIEPLRYRMNVIIQTPILPAFAENDWVGRILQLGRTVRLQILVPTPRCAVPALSHGDLSDQPEALRTVAKLNRVWIPDLGKLPCVGAYARVITVGQIECGDPITLLPPD
jgi:uncharacterized protein YcbX